jgi:hypothetical protein
MEKKKIYIYHITPRMHSSMRFMIENPPEGYEFVVAENKNKKKMLHIFLNSRLIKFIYKKLIKKILNPLKLYDIAYS